VRAGHWFKQYHWGASDQDQPLEFASPDGLQRRLGLVGSGKPNINRRALLYVAIGWFPLLLLATAQDAWSGTDDVNSLLSQLGVHARYLVAVPMLVLAEAVCAPQLAAIVRHLTDSGIVGKVDRRRLDEAAVSTARLLHSSLTEILLIGLACALVIAAIASHPAGDMPVWATSHGMTPLYAPAGWWHMLVSLPLLLKLLLGWLFRLVLWARLLWLISRLDLQLVPSHPDRCAGLAFLGQSLRAFAIVAMAVAVIVAGRSAQIALAGGNLPTPQLYFNIGLLLTTVALLIAPLAVFTPTLMRERRRGIFEYGMLAERAGRLFEQRWLDRQRSDEALLQQPDFSAAADLYQIVSNVGAIRFVPVGLKDVATLVLAMLLPFVPVLLLAVPTEVIWEHLSSLLF
jgi:hypothetical protein